MQYIIFVYFKPNQVPDEAQIKLTWQSLTDGLVSNQIIVTGDTSQILATKNILEPFLENEKQQNEKQIIWCQHQNSGTEALNIAFSELSDRFKSTEIATKVVLVRFGDYFQPNFFSKSTVQLQNLNLFREISNTVPFGNFIYLESSKKVHTAKKVLGLNLKHKDFWWHILHPQSLLPILPYFWDWDLIVSNNLKFDSNLKNFDLEMAKFNLDYLLLVSKLNNDLAPKMLFCEDLVYAARFELMPFSSSKKDLKPWRQTLMDKSEDLKNIAGWKWLWIAIRIILMRK
jgi:hypothetical protein